MTTAHRPTFNAAIGGKEQGGGRYVAGVSRVHVHDLPGQLKLKTRATGQGTQAEVKSRDLRAELEQRETEHFKSIGKGAGFKALEAKAPPPPPPVLDDDDDEDLIIDPEDADDKIKSTGAGAAAAPPLDDSDDEEDDEDDEAELMRELERIKKERAQEALRKEREEAETNAKERDSAILQGNPLLDPTRVGASSSSGGSFAVKRRWDDDVVFKNQSREPQKEGRRFINDTVRNDFHRKFLQRYVK